MDFASRKCLPVAVRPPSYADQRRLERSWLLGAALAALFLFLMPGSARALQFLTWQDGGSFTTFGPNADILIDNGGINFIAHCPGGTDDFVFPAADIYIVRAGTISLGSPLVDVIPGAHNTVLAVSSGAFTAEIIGFTVPGGQIGPGRYAVVYDECQNGVFDAEDALFDPAFEVVVPTNLPPIDPAIQQTKAKARTLETHYLSMQDNFKKSQIYLSWLAAVTAFRAFEFGDIKDFFQSMLCTHEGFAGAAGEEICPPDEEMLARAKAIATVTIGAVIQHYHKIALDPPDPDFMRLTHLHPVQRADAFSSDPRNEVVASLANAMGSQDALAEALLHSMERYQGADAAGNGEWGLIHARSIRATMVALSQQLEATNLALTPLQRT